MALLLLHDRNICPASVFCGMGASMVETRGLGTSSIAGDGLIVLRIYFLQPLLYASSLRELHHLLV
jgi:hypothetical protein